MEEYLKNKHAEIYFNNWLTDLSVDEWILLADEYKKQ